MKKEILVIIILLNFTKNVFAVQLKNFEIKENTSWSGEVIISAPVKVLKQAILTILPGTVMKFVNAEAELKVEGKLIANGLPDNKIVFTSGKDNIYWKGIVFYSDVGGEGKKKGEERGKNSSRLINCVIEMAETGCRCLQGVEINIEDCNFTKNKEAIYFGQGANGIVSNSDFTNNSSDGIFCEQAKAKISKNRFRNNNSGGILCTKNSRVEIEGNFIEGHQYGIISSFIGTETIIKNNILQGNQYGIFSDRVSKTVISNNTIRDNDYGIYLKWDAISKILLNEITKNRVGVYIIESYNLSALAINDNNIYDNNEYEIGLSKMSAEYTIELIQRITSGDTTLDIPSNLQNYIMSGLTPLEYIDAQRNFWGKEITTEMKAKGDSTNISKIEDFYDNPFYIGKRGMGVPGKKYREDYILYSKWREEMVEGAGTVLH